MQSILYLCALLLGVAPWSSGYETYRDRIPNGRAVPHPCKANYVWRGVGHENPLGGGARNTFGSDFAAKGHSWNQELCQMDSDNDGMTNGYELGDPNCTWTFGTLPVRTIGITHPGVCDPWESDNCTGKNTWVDCDVGDFKCAALDDPETQNVTLRFLPTDVPSQETTYMCMTFDLPSDQEYQLVATQPYIDNAQVMHHILVYACEGDDSETIPSPTSCGMSTGKGCDSIIGLWTVGHPGSCTHNNTGFRIGKGAYKKVKLEFHWNNPELSSEHRDSSGMTLFYTTKLRPTGAVTLMVGQLYIEIPPLQPAVEVVGSCTSTCSRNMISEPVTVVEAMNHMHYLGKAQRVQVYRNGTLVNTLTDENTYSYDSPLVHRLDPPVQILPGDEIRTTCVYNSANRGNTTYYGDGTSSEMCFAFLTTYPETAFKAKPICAGYKSQGTCELWNPTSVICDDFLNTKSPIANAFWADIMVNCTAFSPCRPECREAVARYANHQCMQGNTFEELKTLYFNSKEGTMIIAAMDSCSPRHECPQCPQCPNANQNAGTETDDGSSAAALLPGVVTMVTALMTTVMMTGPVADRM